MWFLWVLKHRNYLEKSLIWVKNLIYSLYKITSLKGSQSTFEVLVQNSVCSWCKKKSKKLKAIIYDLLHKSVKNYKCITQSYKLHSTTWHHVNPFRIQVQVIKNDKWSCLIPTSIHKKTNKQTKRQTSYIRPAWQRDSFGLVAEEPLQRNPNHRTS